MTQYADGGFNDIGKVMEKGWEFENCRILIDKINI